MGEACLSRNFFEGLVEALDLAAGLGMVGSRVLARDAQVLSVRAVELLRQLGFRYRDMEIEDGHRMMVAAAACRYRAPARFDDDVVIRTAAASASEKVIRFSYEVRDKKTWKLLATGETAHVVTDLNNRPSRLPARYRKYFRLRTG